MRVALLCCLLGLAVLSACSVSPSPVLPPAPLQALDNNFAIRKVWSNKLGAGASDQYLSLVPVIHQQVAYAVDWQGKLMAVDTTTGKFLWERDTGIPFTSPISFNQDRLYVGSADGLVIAFDSRSGKPLWRSQLSSEILASPQATQEIVVARCVDGRLYGLNAQTGQRLWVNEQRTPVLTLRGTSAPVIAGDIVLAGYDSGKLVAFNLQNGKVLWQATVAVPTGRTDLERMIDIDGNLVVFDDIVYTVAFQGRLAAIQLGSGRVIWTRDLDSYRGFALDSYRIYLSSSEGEIWALDRQNGATLWKQDELLRRVLTRPQLHKHYLVIGDYNGYLHWVRRDTGKLAARVRMRDNGLPGDPQDEQLFSKMHNILFAPLVDQHRLLAVDRLGHLEAYEVAYP